MGISSSCFCLAPCIIVARGVRAEGLTGLVRGGDTGFSRPSASPPKRSEEHELRWRGGSALIACSEIHLSMPGIRTSRIATHKNLHPSAANLPRLGAAPGVFGGAVSHAHESALVDDLAVVALHERPQALQVFSHLWDRAALCSGRFEGNLEPESALVPGSLLTPISPPMSLLPAA